MPLQNASDRIPILARHLVSDRAKRALDAVQKFVEEECIPADAVFQSQLGSGTQERFSAHPPVIEALKAQAKQLGLWNLFLPKNHFSQGAGFSNLEYGLMAEWLGRSVLASEVKGTPNKAPKGCLMFTNLSKTTGYELQRSGHG
jgi:acyl-CoA dehydrogenase